MSVVLVIERERLVNEARLAGLRPDTPTLAAVNKRRTQVLTFAVVALAGIVATWSVRPVGVTLPVPLETVRPFLAALGVGVIAYGADRERRLRRLTSLLIDERALSSALMLRLDEVRTMLDVAKAMNSSSPLDAILGTITRAAASVMGAQSGMMLLLDGDALHVVSSAGAAAEPGNVLPLEGSAAHVVHTWEMLTESARDGQPQTMYLPVRHGPELLGLLVLAAHPARQFGDYDHRAAELFAEQAACAIAQTHRAHAARWQREERARETERRGKIADHAAVDVRDPMASLVAATKMLQRPKLVDSERLELAGVIERQATRLGKAVEELLLSVD